MTSAVMALGFVVTASAATTYAGTLREQKVAGPYRLMLVIGPAQNMSEMGSEMTVGGKAATCRTTGKGMTSSAPMHAPTCNRHVELHVFDAHTNKVLLAARVGITLRDAKNHMAISVPIMEMMAGSNLRDFHYGNNIHAAPGQYTIKVTVNAVHATFAVKLK
ncbi:MAG TPA: hypothetical protein VF221_03045 [Chloroflexota bacterium]